MGRVLDGVGEAVGRRLGRYTRAKRDGMRFLAYLEDVCPPEWSYLQRLYGCARQLEFHRFDDGRAFLVGGKFCGNPLLCQVDAIRKGGSRLRRVFPRLLGLTGGVHGLRASMVTMTQRVDAEATARDLVLRLQEVWRGWWHASRQKRTASALRHVLGGFWQYEIADSRKWNSWHVHAHGVWLHEGWLDRKALGSEYSTRIGYSAQLKIDLLKSSEFRRDAKGPVSTWLPQFENLLLEDCLEVIKYTVKFHGLSCERRLQAWDELANGVRTRLCDSFGIMRGVSAGLVEASDPGRPLGGDYERLLFEYASGGYQLRSSGRYTSRGWSMVESVDGSASDDVPF